MNDDNRELKAAMEKLDETAGPGDPPDWTYKKVEQHPIMQMWDGEKWIPLTDRFAAIEKRLDAIEGHIEQLRKDVLANTQNISSIDGDVYRMGRVL